MAGRPIEIGPAGVRLGLNVGYLRRERKMTLVELSSKLASVGRPIPAQGLARIEAGERRVDIDDLDALALVFGVTPHTVMRFEDGMTTIMTIRTGGGLSPEILEAIDEAVRRNMAVVDDPDD
jgi:transcriptional regulator with XRE-family HTH domain